jgi:SAM-dependent methyltransferase|tara:strand:- start:2529 stop:3257 length:729 start_codon:yes stop_codon:yes gene_type:complete
MSNKILKIEKERELFDKHKKDYQDSINEQIGSFGGDHNLYLEIKANHLKDYISKNIKNKTKVKILDFGCGHGFMHPFFNKDEFEIEGCDPATEVIELAKKINPHFSYSDFDGEHLPYENDTFDVSIAVSVIHHVPPELWLNSIKELKRVTKENGFVIVYEHNPLNPLTLRLVNNCPLDENANLLRMNKMKKLYFEAGFKKIKKQFIIFFPFKAEIFRILEKLISKIPLGAQYFVSGKVQKES